jgi:hypothetical protein
MVKQAAKLESLPGVVVAKLEPAGEVLLSKIRGECNFQYALKWVEILHKGGLNFCELRVATCDSVAAVEELLKPVGFLQPVVLAVFDVEISRRKVGDWERI